MYFSLLTSFTLTLLIQDMCFSIISASIRERSDDATIRAERRRRRPRQHR